MALPPHDATATHTLLSDDYPDAVQALFATATQHASDAFVRLDRTEVDDAARCRRVWKAVRPAFTSTEALGSSESSSWFRTALPANDEALARLLELVEGHVGTVFVHTVALAASPNDRSPDDRHTDDRSPDDRHTDERRWLARAVPHHSVAVLTDDDPALVAAAEDALAPLRACLVETGTRVAWTAGDRRYRVAGGSVCRETLDGGRRVCFGLTRLRYVDRSDERTIRLTWRRPDRPDNRVVSTVVRAFDRLSPDPPTVLRAPDEATADRVAAVLEDFVQRFESTEPDVERAG